MATNSTNSPLIVTEVQGVAVKKLWPAILYTSLLMVMGSVGNSIVCYVYGFRWQSTVTKIFIFSLGALDLLNSLICMPTEIVMLVNIVTFDVPSWCKITRFLTYTLNGSSSLILVAIALDRWYKVCRPLQCFFTHSRAKWACCGALLFAAALSWPSLVLYGNLSLPIVGTNAMGVTCLVSDQFIDTWWPLVFYCVYFTCYMFLVFVITVLYSMIAFKIVRLKKLQKERLAAKYAGLRSSKLMYPSQESIPLTNHNLEDNEKIVDTNCGVKIQLDGTETEKTQQTYPRAPHLQHFQEENEGRRSVTFRLPRKSTNSVDTIPETAGKGTQNGIQIKTPDIVVDERKEEDEDPDNNEEETDPGKDQSNTQDHNTQASTSAEDLAITESFVQIQDNLQVQGCSENSRLMCKTDAYSNTGSPEDTDEFEQGIHFTAHADLTWQHNPIVNSDNCQTQVNDNDSHDDSKDLSCDTFRDEIGSKSSLLSDKTKERVTKTRSDSFTLIAPHRESESGKSKVHKTSSDSNLFISERHQSMTTCRRSFLVPHGGYPGGHTPTSRLPTPAETPSPSGIEAKPVLLSSKLILEKLNKKMAYRPAKTTRMLFAISIVFVISFLPFFCIVITRATQGRAFFANLSDAGVLAINICIRSSFISNAANPIIYGLCNKQFRTECGHLFGRCVSKRPGVTLRVIEATDDVLGSHS